MRYFFISIFLFISCNKKHLGDNNGCISQIKRHYIAGTDSVAAVKLLRQNNIAYKNIRFDKIILNDTIMNNGKVAVYQDVFAIKYYNGLPVLLQAIVYHFKWGVYQFASAPNYNDINLNATPELTLPELRKLYLNELINNRRALAGKLKDKCLAAEFGYYDLNGGSANTSPDLVKAWVVTPENANYPEVLFRDDTGQTIFYTNGQEIVN